MRYYLGRPATELDPIRVALSHVRPESLALSPEQKLRYAPDGVFRYAGAPIPVRVVDNKPVKLATIRKMVALGGEFSL